MHDPRVVEMLIEAVEAHMPRCKWEPEVVEMLHEYRRQCERARGTFLVVVPDAKWFNNIVLQFDKPSMPQ